MSAGMMATFISVFMHLSVYHKYFGVVTSIHGWTWFLCHLEGKHSLSAHGSMKIIHCARFHLTGSPQSGRGGARAKPLRLTIASVMCLLVTGASVGASITVLLLGEGFSGMSTPRRYSWCADTATRYRSLSNNNLPGWSSRLCCNITCICMLLFS